MIEKRSYNAGEVIRELLDSSYQGVKRFFVLAYYNTDADANLVDVNYFKKYFLPRVTIKNWNIKIDGSNFYDQPIYYMLEKPKERTLEFYKGTAKIL